MRPVPASLRLVSMNYKSFGAGVAATFCLFAFYSATIVADGNYGPFELVIVRSPNGINHEAYLLNTNTGQVRSIDHYNAKKQYEAEESRLLKDSAETDHMFKQGNDRYTKSGVLLNLAD